MRTVCIRVEKARFFIKVEVLIKVRKCTFIIL